MTPMIPMTHLIEIVASSVADARAAKAGGAQRLELCIALPSGGLTPSVGLLQAVQAVCDLPVMAMVRPRSGGFIYSEDEQAVMYRDAAQLIAAGAQGLVFGVLDSEGDIDTEAMRALVEIAAGRETVCHRAFDLTADPFAALETLIELGVTRVLTSGQQKTALEGADLLRELQQRAAGRIEILLGGGVRATNARELIERTGCQQLHLAPMVAVPAPPATGPVQFGTWDTISEEAVAAIVAAVQSAP